MIPFTYERATDVPAAVDFLRDHDGAKLIAGGTNLLDLMKLQIETPKALVDINHIGLDEVARMVDDGRIRTTLTETLSTINAETLKKAHALLGDDPVFVANIDSIWIDRGDALADLVRRFDQGQGLEWEYLLLTATRRAEVPNISV